MRLKDSSALMDMSIRTLVDTLHTICKNNSIEDLGQDNCLNWGILTERDKSIQDATLLANELLIQDDGERHFENEFVLKREGYVVFALEADRSGWLIGGILTPKGIIAYG